MSGLVAYESSNDSGEDVDGNPPTAATTTAPLSTSPHKTDGPIQDSTYASTVPRDDGLRELALGNDANRPVLGPTAPAQGEMMRESLPFQAPELMSERDAIRHRTQPPIPMTSMPSSPPGSPNPTANARFARFAELKTKGIHFNEDLCRKASFLNPGLLSTMMARAGIDGDQQYSTSLPLDLWNPKGFPPWAYKEELLKSQQEIRNREQAEKKSLSATGKRVIHFTSAEGTSGESSRKSTPGIPRKRRV